MAVGPEGARIAREEDTGRIADLAAALLAPLGAARGGGLLAHALDRLLASDSLRRCIADSDHHAVLVGTYDDVVVGLALAEHPTESAPSRTGDDRVAVVRVLYVEPEMRGVGVGDALLAELLRIERARGATSLDIAALPGDGATKSFLEGLGFRARLLVMHRSLEPETEAGR
jgi:ribosomal protein S18 acetylase RimI-like enzyme